MTANADWLSPHPFPELTLADVHVWRSFLAVDQKVLRQLESTLSRDEMVRADRFLFERGRNSFIAARGMLRDVLGRYLQCPPRSVEFSYGPTGKPELRGEFPHSPRVRFNLSHSHGLALFAIARARRVGVDLEMIRKEFAGEEIAARYFSAQEADELKNLRPEQKPEGFCLGWTRKEAFVKAKGEGLQIPLNSFHVSLAPGEPATLMVPGQPEWGIESFAPTENQLQKYAAAVVVEGMNYRISFFQWGSERLTKSDVKLS